MPYEFAALIAALSWVFAAMIAADTAREIGGMAFNRLRTTTALLMLLVIVFFTGGIMTAKIEWLPILIFSGIAGIAIGDSALFAAVKRLGPRRSQVLYACNAPIAVILGVLFLNESPTIGQMLGIIAVFAGVIIAIIWGKRASQIHRWEDIQGALWVGVCLGLLSGLGQAVGSILVKPILDSGADLMVVTAVRIGAAALILVAIGLLREPKAVIASIKPKYLITASANALIAVVIGVSLLMYAFALGNVGIASILSATTPILALPILWITTKERPAIGAWFGAALAVAGSAAIIWY